MCRYFKDSREFRLFVFAFLENYSQGKYIQKAQFQIRNQQTLILKFWICGLCVKMEIKMEIYLKFDFVVFTLEIARS